MEQPTIKPFGTKRSLSSYFSKCTKVLIGNLILGILIILGWTVPQTNATTSVEITTAIYNNNIQIFQETPYSTISDYWKSSAYLTAVALCITSLIWPFVIVLSLGFVWIKPLYPATRTKLILFTMLTAKLTLLSAFTDAIMIYSTYMDVKYDDEIEITITTLPVASFAIYAFTNFFAIALTDVFFIWDQSYCYIVEKNMKNFNVQLQYTDNEDKYQHIDKNKLQCSCCRILAFEYKPKSYLGIIMLSLFFTLIVSNTWIILESWYTVALRLNMKGLLSLILSDSEKVRSYSLIQIPGKIYDTGQKGDATTLSLVFAYFGSTIVSSMALQFGILVIWFMPLCNFKYFGWLVKVLLVGQSVNCFELYFVSCFLTAAEIDAFSKWEINGEFPKQCADSDMVPQLFGSCFYVVGYCNLSGMLLAAAVIVIHWFTLYITIKILPVKHLRF